MIIIATVKEKIYAILSETTFPVAYATSYNEFPYIRYTLISNDTKRLSNGKSIKRTWYQIDVFSLRPYDVESENILVDIEKGLEKHHLYTTDWLETIDPNNDTGYPVYHYFIEVRG